MKYRYDESERIILQGNLQTFLDSEKIKEDKHDDVEELIDDMIKNLSWREMARKYGRDYMKNYKAYQQYALNVALEETGDIPQHLLFDKIEERQNIEIRKCCEEISKKATSNTMDFVMEYFDSKFGEEGYVTKEFKGWLNAKNKRNDSLS